MTHARHHSYSKNPLIRISRDRRECPNYRECGHNNWTMLWTSPNLYPFLDVSDLSFAWWYARKSLFCELPGGGSIRAHRPAKPCTFPLGRSTQIFTSSLVSRPDHHVFWVRLWFLLRIRISWSAAVECAAIFPPELGEEFKLTESRPNLSELVRGFSHRTMQNLDGTRRCVRFNRKSKLTGAKLMGFYCMAKYSLLWQPHTPGAGGQCLVKTHQIVQIKVMASQNKVPTMAVLNTSAYSNNSSS